MLQRTLVLAQPAVVELAVGVIGGLALAEGVVGTGRAPGTRGVGRRYYVAVDVGVAPHVASDLLGGQHTTDERV